MRSDDVDEDEDQHEHDDNDDDGYNATDTNSASDDNGDYYGHSRHKRKGAKMAMAKRVRGRKEKRRESKERKSHESHGDEGGAGGEISELRRMIRDLKQMQKAIIPPGTGVVAGCTKEDIILLDTYAVGQGNGRCPYRQRDASDPNTHQIVYPDGHGEMPQPVDYYQKQGGYPGSHKEGYQGTGQIVPATDSYFDNSTKQPAQVSHIPQPSNPLSRTFQPFSTYRNTPE